MNFYNLLQKLNENADVDEMIKAIVSHFDRTAVNMYADWLEEQGEEF